MSLENKISILSTLVVFQFVSILNFNYISDFDTLAKMFAGHEEYLSNPDQQVLPTFDQPSSGLMTAQKRDMLENALVRNANEPDRPNPTSPLQNLFRYTESAICTK